MIKMSYKVITVQSFCVFHTRMQWRRHGGGGSCPPYDFEGKKGEEGKRRKGRGEKEKGGEKKKREERKKEKTNKQTKKKRLWHFACKITPFSYRNFQKFSLSDGSPLGHFAPSLWRTVDKSCLHHYRPITGTAKGHKHPPPLLPVDWSKSNFKRGSRGLVYI